MKMNRSIFYSVALLASFVVPACENKGFDDEPEDPYSSSGESQTLTADTVWLNQFTLNRGIRSMAVLNENGDTVEFASFKRDGTPELYLNGNGGVGYEFDENGRPTVVYGFEGSSASYYQLEYGNDADLLVPVYDNMGAGLYNFAALHTDDARHFSILPGLSKVTKRSADNKTVWIRKYVFVDAGSSQWMKVYSENHYSGGKTKVDRIEYTGKLPAFSDSLSIDTIVFTTDRFLESYRYRYQDENGALITETCRFINDGRFLYPQSTVQDGGEYRVEYRYSTGGNLDRLILDGQQVYSATYESDASGNGTVMRFNGMTFRRSITYY